MLFSILPPAAREIGISPFQVSTIFATSAALWVVCSPWWGRRSDVTGRRPIMLVGLLGYATSMVAFATTLVAGRDGWLPLAVVFPLLIVSRCIFALVGSGTGPASQAYVADRTSLAERSASVAFLNAAMGVGETIGPGLGSALAGFGVVAPLYCAAALAALSAITIWVFLPEDGPPSAVVARRAPRLRATDPRVLPFIIIGAALQAVRATTIITLSLFLQDTMHLNAEDTVRLAGYGFVALAAAQLVAQLLIVQRWRPSSRQMMHVGAPLMLLAFVGLVLAQSYAAVLVAMVALGLGIGLLRPGSATGASVSVESNEQGGVAGLLGGVTVVGNVFGPMLGTRLYALTPHAPYMLNAVLMAGIVLFIVRHPHLRRLRA